MYLQSDLEESAANEEDKPAKKVNGYVNEQGARCWREDCEGTFIKLHVSMRFTVTAQVV